MQGHVVGPTSFSKAKLMWLRAESGQKIRFETTDGSVKAVSDLIAKNSSGKKTTDVVSRLCERACLGLPAPRAKEAWLGALVPALLKIF